MSSFFYFVASVFGAPLINSESPQCGRRATWAIHPRKWLNDFRTGIADARATIT